MNVTSQKSKPTPLRHETWLTPPRSNVVRTSLRTNARSLTNHLKPTSANGSARHVDVVPGGSRTTVPGGTVGKYTGSTV